MSDFKPEMRTVPNMDKLAKEWANAEVAALIAGVLDQGNTILSTADDRWLEENLVGLLPAGGFGAFESMVEDEMISIFRQFTNKSGEFKGIGQ